MNRYLRYLLMAFVLSGCAIPVAVAIPMFTTAAITGAGVAVGMGAVDVGWAHLPVNQPSVTPTPVEK